MSLNFIKAWSNDKWYVNKTVLIWRFTLVLIKINYGQIGDQTRLFYTTNPVFYTSTGTFGNLIFSLIPSDSRNTRSTCPKSVLTGIGQTLMSRPALIYSLVSSDNRNTRSTCPTSVFTGTGQTLMSRPGSNTYIKHVKKAC